MDPGIESGSPAWQAGPQPPEPPGQPLGNPHVILFKVYLP